MFSFVIKFLFFPADDDMPCRLECLRQAVEVHGGDQHSTRPTADQQKPTVLPRPHALARTREVEKWKHGEWKLQGQYHLAQCQQVGNATLASQSNDENRRQDRE